MTYKEAGFRAFYHHFCFVRLNKNIEKIMNQVPGAEVANGVLTYGYYDREAGLTLEVLGAAIIDDDDFKYMEGDSRVSLKLRIGSVAKTEFFCIPDEDGHLAEEFSDRLERLKIYDASEVIESTREMEFLDPYRHEYYIDDILVRLLKENLNIEQCWVRITGLGDRHFIGTLLNEPYQDFGWHEGDTVTSYARKREDGEIELYLDMFQ